MRMLLLTALDHITRGSAGKKSSSFMKKHYSACAEGNEV
jgi:hypothetical protein